MMTLPFTKEPNHLFNLYAKNPQQIVECFYIKKIIPISFSEHLNAVNIDSIYNIHCINPIYQYFVSTFLFSNRIMDYIEDIFGTDDFYEGANEAREHCFQESFIEDFFSKTEYNTSVEGFIYGLWWIESRKRVVDFLKNFGLIEIFETPNPLKFPGFLYPDDFESYTSYPNWSEYGEFISFSEWESMKNTTLGLYCNHM